MSASFYAYRKTNYGQKVHVCVCVCVCVCVYVQGTKSMLTMLVHDVWRMWWHYL